MLVYSYVYWHLYKVSFIFCRLLKLSGLRWCSPVKHLALSRRRSRVQWNARLALDPNKSRPEHTISNRISSNAIDNFSSFRRRRDHENVAAGCNMLPPVATIRLKGEMLRKKLSVKRQEI